MGVEHGKLPLPPADLASRPLPLTRISGPLFRVHRITLGALYFGKGGKSRFDDPRGKYGVLYAALKPEAAFAEVFLRQLSQMLVEEEALAQRALSEIALKSIPCVNLTARGLRRISCDNRIADEVPYDTPGQWSRALYDHPQKPAGILYRSRHNPQLTCAALFSGFEKQLSLKKTTPLLHTSLRAWTGRQVSRYGLALIS